nr:telomerase protein component 1-like [Lytechinus pictus]
MSYLSNPLLTGSLSSGLTATKRKARDDGCSQASVPSKQTSTGMSLQKSSLFGSSLLGGVSKKDGKSQFNLGMKSSSLGTKSPLIENKLLSSATANTGLHSKLQGSSGRSLLAGGSLLSMGSSLSSSSSLSASGYGSVLKGSQKTRSLSRSNSTQAEESKTKKIKAQHLPEQSKEDNVIDPTLTTCELPDYDFSRQLPVAKPAVQEYDHQFEKLDMAKTLTTKPGENYSTKLKQQFINAVSASLIGGPNFHERGDSTRKNINRQATSIINEDPEFILKVALYTRKELNIRTTANFLLALAAMTPECRPFLRKYFSSSIALPSDWIDVAELYQTFHDKNINYGSLPSALRKAMIDRFPRFDQYQLAKYNKDKKKKKPAAKTDKPAKEENLPDDRDDGDSENSDTDEEEMERLSFTLKQLIRKLHINDPVDSVMCLLGKRYPEDMESFYQSRLPGTWDAERAGKRMKLPTPETWETQVSLKGNKAPVWEQLIDNKKLPFMAMLRNLRNMIAAGISEKHHKWVLYKLTDRGSVVYSKQFPFRFFSAYEVLQSMERELEKADKLKEQLASGIRPPQPRGKRARKEDQVPKWKRAKMEKKRSELPYDITILNRYRKALDTAVKIATSYNVKPIPGKTLLLCNVGSSMETPCSSAKGLGKKRTVSLNVPNKLRSQFVDENAQRKERLASLKETIRTSGSEVFDGYPCHFGGQPISGTCPCHHGIAYPEDGEILDEVVHERAQHDMFLQSQLATFTGRKNQVKQCLDIIKKPETGLLMVAGKQGCGKTALLASVMDTLQSRSIHPIVHFVGAVPGSSHVSPLLKRLCNELGRRYGLQSQVPQEYKIHPICLINVVFILSAVASSPAHAAAVRRQASVVELGPLDLMDKAEMVRSTLAAHHKTLDESPFNNQMKLLVSKREANLPLFLKLACEELRVFGVFEEVSTRLKAMSHTIGTLLQEVLKRLEDDHGQDMITVALALLVSTRDGLYEEDLHCLLSLHRQLKESKYTYNQVTGTTLGPEVMLPQAEMSRLVRGIKSLLAPTGEHSDHRLRVSHGQISQAIVQRYMKGAASELQIRTHALLSGYFNHLSRTKNVASPWSTDYPHALTEMPYHLVQAGLFAELKNVLSDPFFIQAKCSSGLTASLLEDFQANTSTTSKAILREREKFLTNPLITGLRSFISRHLHILTLCPGLLWQQAMNEPNNSLVRDAMLESAGSGGKGMVAWRNKRETADECAMTLTGFTDAVLCVAIAPGAQIFAVGTKNCQLKLFEMETGKELKSFIGHSDAVTSCCFVGKSRLVSASRDKTLSLWDVEQGFRVNTLKGHRGLVSGCISDSKGVNLASCGWDCRVLIWDGRSGKQTSDITEPRPISCLSYHPEGKLLVTGSWDATLKIWDTFNKKRVAILRGHRSSVRAVTYSPTGRHIASASLDGAVKLWSADTGTQVGSLCGHSQPINHIAFSQSGRELVTVSNDHKTKVWSGNLGKQLATFKGKDQSASTQATFSTDGEFVAMGYHSGEVKVIEVASKREVFASVLRESRVKGIAWLDDSKDGLAVLVGYESGHAVIIKGVEKSKQAVVPLKTNHAAITSLAYSNATHTAAVTYDNMCVALWSYPLAAKAGAKDGIPPTNLLHPKCNGVITCCTFSPSGDRLVLGTRDAMLFVYKVWGLNPESQPALHLDNCHKDWINSCAWSPATDVLATASNDSTIKLWDMKTGKVKSHLKGHQAAVYSVAFSHGCVVSGCLDASVKVWTHRGVEITTLYGHSQKANKVDIHIPERGSDVPAIDVDSDDEGKDDTPGANWSDMMAEEEWKNRHEKKKLDKDANINLEEIMIASASDDGTTQLWKPLQSNELTTLIGHSDRVLSVAMATSGQVVTTSMDCTVKIWKPQLSPDLVHIGAHDGEVSAVAMSTKTNFAVTASRNGSACLWKVNGSNKDEGQSMKLLHSWMAAECAVNAVCFIGKHMTFVLGKDDGVITLWKIQELKDKPGSYTTVKGNNRFLNVHSFTSMPSPVTCLRYDDAQDILYVGTWSSVITLKGFTSNKIKQNAKGVPGWVLDMTLVKDKGIGASLSDGKVVCGKEKTIETLDICELSPVPVSWCRSLIISPPQIGNPRLFLVGDSDGHVMHVSDNRVVNVIKQVRSLRFLREEICLSFR